MAKMTGVAPFFNIKQTDLFNSGSRKQDSKVEGAGARRESSDKRLESLNRKLRKAKGLQESPTESLAPRTARRQQRNSDLEASVARTSAKLLTGQFAAEVRRLLAEQEVLLPLLETSREWTLKLLNRQYYAIRTAAEMLKQDNLATIVGRAEVLVSLISGGLVSYRSEHREVLKDTAQLLSSSLDLVEKEGSDTTCYEQARTAIYLYAAAEPTTQRYIPSAASPTKAKVQGHVQ